MLNFSNVSIIYVSQKCGRETFSGFSPVADRFGGGPLDSVEHAIEKICQFRASGNFRPITVRFCDEEYYIEKPIELIPSALHNRFFGNDCLTGITFDSVNRTKIIGGRKLSGFKKDIFNGHDCFSVHIPDVEEGKWFFTDLYVDGGRAKFTRFPKEGTLTCVDTEFNKGEIATHSKWFIAHKQDLEGIKDVESAIVSYYHYWIDEHSPVESYDRETGKLTMAYKSRFLITNLYEEEHCPANLHYYLENIAEVFENPGEWYLERKSGMLYYIPENDSQTPENIQVYAPVVDRIVDVCGSSEHPVSDIRFRGLDFICSKGDYASRVHTDKTAASDDVFGSDSQSVAGAYGAVNFRYARNCIISDCSLKNLGVQAVSVEEGCSDIRVEGCTVYDVGAGGVRIFGGAYGCEKHDETHHITVKDCNISYCGRRYAAGCGILANHVYSCEFSDNEIGYLDYSGISVGWVWGYADNIACANRITNNHIHHIGMGNLSDMGGIYLLGKQRGTVVSGNRIHDVICRHYGGWGIYTVEGASYMTIENTVVYRT